jgi:hypothetical protein
VAQTTLDVVVTEDLHHLGVIAQHLVDMVLIVAKVVLEVSGAMDLVAH